MTFIKNSIIVHVSSTIITVKNLIRFKCSLRIKFSNSQLIQKNFFLSIGKLIIYIYLNQGAPACKKKTNKTIELEDLFKPALFLSSLFFNNFLIAFKKFYFLIVTRC